MVATCCANENVKDTRFPLAWTKAHFSHKPATYSIKESRLDAEDKETLQMLQSLVSRLLASSKGINVRSLVRARSH